MLKPVEAKGTPPTKRSYHSATIVVQEMAFAKIVVFGGYDGDDFLDDVHTLDASEWEWVEVPVTGDKMAGRCGHTGTLFGDHQILYFGGNADTGESNDLYSLDTNTWSWFNQPTSGNPPTPRSYHSACITNEFLAVFGGWDGERCLNDMLLLNTSTWSWTMPKCGGDIPLPRFTHSANTLGNEVLVFGGFDDVRQHNEVYAFDVTTNKWRTQPCGGAVPCPRSQHAAVIVKDNLVVFGGSDGRRRLSDLAVLDLNDWTWNTMARTQATERAQHTANVIGNSVVVFGGFSGSDRLNSFDKLDMRELFPDSFMTHRGMGDDNAGSGGGGVSNAEMNSMEKKLNILFNTVDTLKDRVSTLEDQNGRLRQELDQLKGAAGGSAGQATFRGSTPQGRRS